MSQRMHSLRIEAADKLVKPLIAGHRSQRRWYESFTKEERTKIAKLATEIIPVVPRRKVLLQNVHEGISYLEKNA